MARLRGVWLLCIGAVAVLGVACSSNRAGGSGVGQRMDAALDCPQVCSRYRDCFDSNYNTDTCVERCNANAKNSSDFYRSVNTCQACISDRSCGSATFSCAGECVSVVP